jgi:ABC-type phosphate transport system auxiliary subunit
MSELTDIQNAVEKRLRERIRGLEAQVEGLRGVIRKHDGPGYATELAKLEAERDRLQHLHDLDHKLADQWKEKANYWERQYVIESENADDFHAERDRLAEQLQAMTKAMVAGEIGPTAELTAERDRATEALRRRSDD